MIAQKKRTITIISDSGIFENAATFCLSLICSYNKSETISIYVAKRNQNLPCKLILFVSREYKKSCSSFSLYSLFKSSLRSLFKSSLLFLSSTTN